MLTKVIILLILIDGLVAGCQPGSLVATETPCSQQAAYFLSQMETLLREWQDRPALLSDIPGGKSCDDTRSFEGISACIDMVDRVSEIQRIRRNVGDLSAPDCATNVQIYLLQYMDGTIDAYQAYLEQEPETTVGRKLEILAGYRDQFYQELAKARATPAP